MGSCVSYPPRRYGAFYSERVPFKRGELLLRFVRPEDKARLVDGFERLSDLSRWHRFLSARHELSDADLRYLTEFDEENHVAIGAMFEGQGVAVARAVRFRPGARIAELAVTVLDDFQHLGIGRILAVRVADAARERGVTSLRVETAADNEAMRRLAHSIGGTVRILTSDSGVIIFDVTL
jgi:GNAT superfamily N-acetyltransferase